MSKELKARKDVEQSLTWDLTAIFKTEEEFNLAVKEAQKLTEEVEKEYKGKLNSANVINECVTR